MQALDPALRLRLFLSFDLRLLVVLLAFGTQAVSAISTVQFSNVVEQCGQFAVNFSGPGQTSMPLTLTLIPFNSHPVYIPIPITSWNATSLTGAFFAFLPLPAKTLFVASLDDAQGHTAGAVSDVIQIQNTSDSSCLPQKPGHPSNSLPQFRLENNNMLSQCGSFDVKFNSSTVRSVPSIRGFTPRANSFNVTMNNGTLKEGKAEYVMNAFRGSQVVLLIDDGDDVQETTGLETVGGDSTSKINCFMETASHNSMSSSNSNKNNNNNSSLSGQTKVIVGTVSGGTVAIIGIIMAYLIKRRRLHPDTFSKEDTDATTQSYESSYNPIFSSLAPSMSLVDSRISVFRTSASQRGNASIRVLGPIIESGNKGEASVDYPYSFSSFAFSSANAPKMERPSPSVPLPMTPRMESEVPSRASIGTNPVRRSSTPLSEMAVDPKSLSTYSMGLASISRTSSLFAAPARRDSENIIEHLPSARVKRNSEATSTIEIPIYF